MSSGGRWLCCEELPIAPSTYYARKTAEPSATSVGDEIAHTEIRRVYEENLGVYGARKAHAQLRREGHRYARCTVERLMRRRRAAACSGTMGRAPPFPPIARTCPRISCKGRSPRPRPISSGVADITYIRTFAG